MSARSWLRCAVGFPAVAMAIGLLMGQHPAALAQEAALGPPPADAVQPPDEQGDVDYLLRGPMHEAFGEPVKFNPEPGLIVPKAPPQPVNEIPADAKPEGDAVWMPGYWAWDDEREDFLWVSGGYRVPPPDRRWVPGYWQQVDTGYQWIAGFWAPVTVEEVSYLPEPPVSLEQGPSSPAPSQEHFWVAGYWNYDSGDYAWRPGYWARGYDNWTWTPTHYVWTPRGCVFVPGYWDYGLVNRGWLFTPVVWRTPLYTQPGYYYRPYYVVDFTRLYMHLFVRPGYSHYYYGDWYGTYARRGIYAPFTFHGRYGYDPLWTYYRWHFGRQGIDFVDRVQGWHRYYERHRDYRPPHTWHDQQQFVRRHRDYDHLRDVVLGEGLREFTSARARRVEHVSDEARERMRSNMRAYRELADARRGGESPFQRGEGRDFDRTAQRLRLPDTPEIREARQRIAERLRTDGRERADRDAAFDRDRSRSQFEERLGGDAADRLRRQTDEARELRERMAERLRSGDVPRADGRGEPDRDRAGTDAADRLRRQTDEARELRERMTERLRSGDVPRADGRGEPDRDRTGTDAADRLRRQTDEARELRERMTERLRSGDVPRADGRGELDRDRFQRPLPDRSESRAADALRRSPVEGLTPGRVEPRDDGASLRRSFRIPQSTEAPRGIEGFQRGPRTGERSFDRTPTVPDVQRDRPSLSSPGRSPGFQTPRFDGAPRGVERSPRSSTPSVDIGRGRGGGSSFGDGFRGRSDGGRGDRSAGRGRDGRGR